MMRALIGLALVGVLLLAGADYRTAQARETGSFRSVTIESHPKGWGFAHKTVTGDGVIIGAHMSGGPNSVRVHETKSNLTRKDMRRLKTLIASLRDARVQSGGSPPDQKAQGYFSLTIELQNGKTMTVHTSWDKKFEHGNVQAIWDLVHKYKVGSW